MVLWRFCIANQVGRFKSLPKCTVYPEDIPLVDNNTTQTKTQVQAEQKELKHTRQTQLKTELKGGMPSP